MNTLYRAIQAGLITSVSINKRGVVIYSSKKPHGAMYSWEKYNTLIPTLKSKLQQLEEANAGTLEPQA
jgi:hypothetical protein